MFCSRCGTRLPADAVFCPRCGQRHGLPEQLRQPEQPPQTNFQVRHANTALILGLLIGGLSAMLIGLILDGINAESGNRGVFVTVLIFFWSGLISLVTGEILSYIVVYHMWKMIQDGFARTTPGKAIGFLFIPFFSYYWIFVAFRGLAIDYNGYINRHGLTAPTMSVNLFTAFCVVSVSGNVLAFGPSELGLASGFGFWVLLAAEILRIIITKNCCDAVNSFHAMQAAEPLKLAA
jgi:hypothetical protein